jgi:hypothetical protein
MGSGSEHCEVMGCSLVGEVTVHGSRCARQHERASDG